MEKLRSGLGKPMKAGEFGNLTHYIHTFHKFGQKGRMIKYIAPQLDLRTFTVYHVEFRGLFSPDGVKVFDYRDNDKPLEENIRAWLREAEKEDNGGKG